jgi:chemotaxis protein CheC
MEKKGYKLDEMGYDVLKEISNIGAGNAATALSLLIQNKVSMSVPKVKVLPFAAVPNLFGGADEIVAGILLEASGDLRADLLLLLSWPQAANLLKSLLNKEEDPTFDLSELEISTLEEVGNITINSFLTALGQFANLKFYPSIPALAIDMAGAVLSTPLSRLGEVGEQALVIETNFCDDSNRRVQGYFLFIPGPDDLCKVLEALGVAALNEYS